MNNNEGDRLKNAPDTASKQSAKVLTDNEEANRVRRGTLRNNNGAIDPRLLRLSPRCTAHRKRDGQPWQAPAVRGYRVCRVHGARGGPKTAAGLQRCKEARLKHGRRSAEYTAKMREERALLRKLKADTELIGR